MKLMKTLLGLGLALSLNVAVAAGPSPDAIVKSTVQEVMNTLRSDSKVTTSEAIQLVQTKVFPHFDFERVTATAMGKNWSAASPEQKQRLVKEFQTLLVRAYVSQLIANRNATVEVKPAVFSSSGKEATVTSEVTSPKDGQKTSLAYSFYDGANGWKVGNVSVDGVSLVTSYRNSFNNAVKQGGIDGLIQKMQAKNAQAAK